MKSKRLNLKSFEVSSFVTSAAALDTATIKGGDRSNIRSCYPTEFTGCIGCQTYPGRVCN